MFCIEEEGKIQVQNHVQVQVQNSKFKFKFKVQNQNQNQNQQKIQTSDLTPHPSKIINNATYYHQYH